MSLPETNNGSLGSAETPGTGTNGGAVPMSESVSINGRESTRELANGKSISNVHGSIGSSSIGPTGSSSTGPINSQPSASIPSILQVSRPFFTAAELKYLHGQSIPEPRKLVYSQKKHQVFQFTFRIVKQLKFPLRVLATSMNYYQRYYLFNKFEDPSDNQDLLQDLEKDPFVIATACTFLASKNEDCIKKLKDIQTIANKLRDIDDNDPRGIYLDTQRRAIMGVEFRLLQAIKFDFVNGSSSSVSVDQLVVQFSKKLNIDYTNTMHSWLICFDIMSTPLCLMIPPHCIAVAIIIITLNVKPHELIHKYNKGEPQLSSSNLNTILESIDCYAQFRCPEPLVNEGIVYILDYYVHNMNFSILNEYMPAIDADTGKEQIFKFMDLKSRFNDLKILSQASCNDREWLRQDMYLQPWDYSVSAKGSTRFMLGNKRSRFESELTQVELDRKKKHTGPSSSSSGPVATGTSVPATGGA